MKRGIFIFLAIFIASVFFVFAQQDEFSVRFHSFGKNATIDLKQYLGESNYYLVSSTQNIIVHIDQEKGIAELIARPGWEGSEVVNFRTNESLKKINDTEEIAKFLPAAPEILYLKRVKDEELTMLFEGTIDPSILDLVKEIKREEIKKLSKEIREKTVVINVNDEVDLKLEQGYVPAISMDFSLGEKNETTEEPKPEETGLKLKISNTTLAIIISLIVIISAFFYRKYSLKREAKEKEQGIDYAISKDIKQLSLSKLRRIQMELDKKESTEDFISVIREFFSNYFGIGYDFEFEHLVRRVKDSDLSWRKKNEINRFLDDVYKIIYYPTEKWTQVYDGVRIPKNDLKKLITRMKRIIQSA